MKLYMTTAILFFLETQSVDIVKRPNGDYFITGRGCGILNPIKYLKNFPPKEKLKDYECSFVQLERGTRPLKCNIVFLFVCLHFGSDSVCLHFCQLFVYFLSSVCLHTGGPLFTQFLCLGKHV